MKRIFSMMLLCAAVSLVGCDTADVEDAANSTVEAVGDAAEGTAEAVEDAAEAVAGE